MNKKTNQPLTKMLNCWQAGDDKMLTNILEHTYNDVKRIAYRLSYAERPGQTVRPTALVNESYLRFSSLYKMQWQNRQQYFNAWAGIMRRVLVDRARSKSCHKRGCDYTHTSLDGNEVMQSKNEQHIEALCESLERLANYNQLLHQIVHMRYFVGLNNDEIAKILNISTATVKRKWKLAKSWLFRDLNNVVDK